MDEPPKCFGDCNVCCPIPFELRRSSGRCWNRCWHCYEWMRAIDQKDEEAPEDHGEASEDHEEDPEDDEETTEDQDAEAKARWTLVPFEIYDSDDE